MNSDEVVQKKKELVAKVRKELSDARAESKALHADACNLREQLQKSRVELAHMSEWKAKYAESKKELESLRAKYPNVKSELGEQETAFTSVLYSWQVVCWGC